MTTATYHPGLVGVSFGSANRLLDKLERLGTEPHALVVNRHGTTALEGYWAPYGPGVIHGCQSLTKTVTGIALGAAIHEGILSLEDRLVDIFPEHAHKTVDKPYWDELKVKHIATMSAGMDGQPVVNSSDWLENFFAMDIVHKPGTAYFYNSIACSMVGACIRKKTGQGLLEFMSDRVFRKIGIDPERLRWHKHVDGMENGSGGFVSTARDNALLMELYRRRGVWNGERILDKGWVDFALRVQNSHMGGEALYGGMMWVRETCFVADGAMGQWGMYFPEKDVVIAVNQTISAPLVDGQVRQAVYDFVNDMSEEPVAWTDEETTALNKRLAMLSIQRPPYGENSKSLQALDGRALRFEQGTAHFFADDLNIFDRAYEAPVNGFCFHRSGNDLLLEVQAMGQKVLCPVGLRGYRTVSYVRPVTCNPACTASVTGCFPDEHTLTLEVRWLESCRVHLITFRFDDKGASVTTARIPVGGFDVPDETQRAVWCE